MKQVVRLFVCALLATVAIASPVADGKAADIKAADVKAATPSADLRVATVPKVNLWQGVVRPKNIVHLFEWKFVDVANECEQYLAPNGFDGVQISPVHENTVFTGRPWWERYQTFSYRIITRSGNEEQFVDMIERCNKVGVGIYVDVILNHMTGAYGDVQGTSGETVPINYWNYTLIPYGKDDFHAACDIKDWNNPVHLRTCQLSGLPDLNQTRASVQDKLVVPLNQLLDLGVAGFRVDAAKHILPTDLYAIYKRLKPLNSKYFGNDRRPFMYHETSNGGPITTRDYQHLGAVTEFPVSYDLNKAIRGEVPLPRLGQIGHRPDMVTSEFAIVSVDNHDMQRGHHSSDVITHKAQDDYIMASAYMFAFPYGIPLILSSFNFTNYNHGPPMDANEATISPIIDANTGLCTNGWVCEHRWPQLRKMNEFRNVIDGALCHSWWDNGLNLLGFCRGTRGFFAINSAHKAAKHEFFTCLAEGVYCDVISGDVAGTGCTGNKVYVDKNGRALVTLGARSALAIHVKAMAKKSA